MDLGWWSKAPKSSAVIPRALGTAVGVSAESLHDAVAQGLKVFRTSEWVSHIAANTVITWRTKEAEIELHVRVRDFEARLERSNKSPGEMVRRQRIRDRLKPLWSVRNP